MKIRIWRKKQRKIKSFKRIILEKSYIFFKMKSPDATNAREQKKLAVVIKLLSEEGKKKSLKENIAIRSKCVVYCKKMIQQEFIVIYDQFVI